MIKTHCVYVLWDTEESNIRYVGLSVNVRSRFNGHLSNAIQPHHPAYNTHKSAWIRKCLRDNVKVGYTVIGTCATLAEANALEIRMITSYKKLGFKLTNTTTGGDGATGAPRSEAHRKSIGDARRGTKASEKTREKLREAHKGRVISEKTRERMSATHTGRKNSDASKELVRIASTGRIIPPEAVERSRQKRTGKKRTPEQIERMKIGTALAKKNKKDQAIA